MKQTPKTLLTLSALAGLSFTAAQAATVTWGGATGDWETGTNWTGGSAPDSGTDSVNLGSTPANDITLNSAFTIGSGQTMTDGSNPELILKTGAVLTVGDGGTLDIEFMRTRYTDGGILAVDAGATAVSIASFSPAAIGTLQFTANAAGVTAITAGTFQIRNVNSVARYWNLDVDLANYNVANGDIVLVDYASVDGQFDSYAGVGQTITFTSGWTADIDYAYDIGGGDLGIALTNVIPESGTYALIGGMLALGAVMVRRRR